METNDELMFKDAMINTYNEAAKLGYRPTYFLRMVHELGGVKAAKELIHNAKFSSGFTKLWELDRLDLSVEFLALKPEWQHFFNPEDHNAAQSKLKKLHVLLPNSQDSMSKNDFTSVSRWTVLKDYPVGNTYIQAGSQGINYWDDFQRYVFISKTDREVILKIDDLIADKESFRAVWDD